MTLLSPSFSPFVRSFFSLALSRSASSFLRLSVSDASALLGRTLRLARPHTHTHTRVYAYIYTHSDAHQHVDTRTQVGTSVGTRAYLSFLSAPLDGLPPRAIRPTKLASPREEEEVDEPRSRRGTSLATWRSFTRVRGLVSVLAQPCLHARSTRAKNFCARLARENSYTEAKGGILVEDIRI